jgi:hypothetical protein
MSPALPSTTLKPGLWGFPTGRHVSKPLAAAAGSVQDETLVDRSKGGGAVNRDIDRDRDDNGIPDWQEDENYIDEAPRGAPVGTGGCLLGLLSMMTVAASLTRPARLYLSRHSLKSRRSPQ